MPSSLTLKVVVKVEHEERRQDTSPLTKVWSWLWSSIRDAEQLVAVVTAVQDIAAP